MAAMIAAYLISGATVAAYVTWLVMENRRLMRRLDEIGTQLESPETDAWSDTRAA